MFSCNLLAARTDPINIRSWMWFFSLAIPVYSFSECALVRFLPANTFVQIWNYVEQVGPSFSVNTDPASTFNVVNVPFTQMKEFIHAAKQYVQSSRATLAAASRHSQSRADSDAQILNIANRALI